MTAPRLVPLADNAHPRPHVSVIMPAYNRADLLRKSAQMILDQTLSDLELIVSDDHSTDHTPQVVAELMVADSRVHYHRPTTKGGVTQAMNEAITLSRGQYVQICHDHDIYLPTLTQRLADVMDRHPSVVFVHPGRQWCDHLGNPRPEACFVCGYPEVSSGPEWKRKMLTHLASPVTALSMIRRTALERSGLFDPEFGACSDIDMWLRLCDVGNVGYVNELLLMVRGREPGHPYAGANWTIVDEVIRAHRKHLSSTYHGGEYAYWKLRREIEIDLRLLVDFLYSIYHRQWTDVKNGRSYLRKHGVFLSKMAGFLL